MNELLSQAGTRLDHAKALVDAAMMATSAVEDENHRGALSVVLYDAACDLDEIGRIFNEARGRMLEGATS